MMKVSIRNVASFVLFVSFVFMVGSTRAVEDREAGRQKEITKLQEEYKWWPTDAKPGPVRDEVRGGYWWWPSKPGESAKDSAKDLWGNRGVVYLRKIIFDYKEEELPPPKEAEPRPSLLIKKIIKNVKVYFDFDKADIRDDAKVILLDAVRALNSNPKADILITGNCDIRGTEAYNLKLGKQRGEAVRQFMLGKGIPESRIRIISRGKLDAIAPVTDLVGMQKDRNAQFMVAEVVEVMIPYSGKPPKGAEKVDEGKFVMEKEEEVASKVEVSTREYTVKKDDSLWKIAEKEMGSGHRWKYLYEVNKERIKNPNKLRAGQKIIIPVE